MIDTGKHGEYRWLVSGREVASLPDLVCRFHRRLHLCITCFDSGPLRIMDEEVAQGWTTQGEVVISPPLADGMPIPHDQYDEWYLLGAPEFDKLEVEVFVNYGCFTLVTPGDSYKTYDLTSEKSELDWLASVQERFWLQLDRLKPESYVAIGDNDIVVSRNHRFVEAVREAAPQGN